MPRGSRCWGSANLLVMPSSLGVDPMMAYAELGSSIRLGVEPVIVVLLTGIPLALRLRRLPASPSACP